MTFQIGDKVIYPNHGLGIIERIEEKTILGTTCGFYSLRIASNETMVLVPVGNADSVGLRRAIGDTEVDRLFRILGDGKIDSQQNWKGRFKDNSEKMRSGSIYDVADVLKSLTLLRKSKNLSFREKRMLDRARFLVVSEISEVLQEGQVTIESRVDRALDRSLTTKSRGDRAGQGRQGPARRRRSLAARCAPRRRHHARFDRRTRSRRPGSPSGPGLSCIMRAMSPSADDRDGAALRPWPCRPSAALRSIVAAIRSFATYLAISVYVILVGPPGLLIAWLFKWPGLLFVLSHGGVGLGLALSGITSRLAGADRIPRGRAAVYCAESHEQHRRAAPVPRAPPAAAHALQGGVRPNADSRPGGPGRRLHPGGAAESRAVAAGGGPGRRIRRPRAFVPRVPGRHAKPHR